MIIVLFTLSSVITQVSSQCQDGHLLTVYDMLDDPRCISKQDCFEKNLVKYKDNCLHRCPNMAKYLLPKTRECYKECPLDSVLNGTVCLSPDHCIKTGKVVYKRKCVDLCPRVAQFEYLGVCYESCIGVLNGTRCIPKIECVKTSKVFNGTCIEECPTNTLITTDNECVLACMKGTVEHENMCISNEACIKSKRYIYNTTCVDVCPSDAPLVADSVCSSQCPTGMFVNGTICQLDLICISQGWYIFNTGCTESCPDVAKISSKGKCVSECPKYQVANGTTCISHYECVLMYKVIVDGVCVQSCPVEMPFIQEGICKTKCSGSRLIWIDQCISASSCYSTRNGFQFEGQCVDVCPQRAKYRMNAGYHYMFKRCVTKCPIDTVLEEEKCHFKARCFQKNVNAVVFNNTCLKSCPSVQPYNYSSVCYDKCPPDTYSEGRQCQDRSKCSLFGKGVFFDGSCLNRCPSQAQYQHDGVCRAQCPNNTFRFGIFCSPYLCIGSKVYDGTSCVSITTCKNEGNFPFQGGCIKQCPYGYFLYNSNTCQPLPDVLLSIGITCLMGLLWFIPITLVLYNPGKTNQCGPFLGKNRTVEQPHEMIRMTSRVEDADL